MRQLVRPALSHELAATLAARGEPDTYDDAKTVWKLFRSTQAYGQLKGVLVGMAFGVDRCFYCEDSAGSAIDHFDPMARSPKRTFDWLNHMLACSTCNGNFKREQFPVDGDLALLIDPTVDDPMEHLDFSPSTGRWTHRTERGRVSIEVLGLNRQLLEQRRRALWRALCDHLRALVARLDAVDVTELGNEVGPAMLACGTGRDRSASGLLVWLVVNLHDLNPEHLDELLGADVRISLQRLAPSMLACPEL